MSPFLRPLAARHDAPFSLFNHYAGLFVADRLEAALDSRSRRRGLLGRDGLPERHALVLAPCYAIHTFGMRFPIDVLFVARDGCVVKIVEQLAPWRIAAAMRASITIELAAGAASRARIAPGDRLSIEPSLRGGSTRRP